MADLGETKRRDYAPKTLKVLSDEDAIELLELSSKAGITRGSESLAYVYMFGDLGQKKKLAKREEWSIVAANQGQAKPLNTLAGHLIDGSSWVGRRKEVDRGLKLLKIVAEKGNQEQSSEALFISGMTHLYYSKKHFDLEEGIRLLESSGRADAYFMLGDLYEKEKKKVSTDLKVAAEYYLKAAEMNHYESMEIVEEWYRRGKGFKKNSKEAKRWKKLLDQ